MKTCARVVEQLRARVQAHAVLRHPRRERRRRQRRARRVEEDVRLRLGQPAAEEAGDRRAVPGNALQHLLAAPSHRRGRSRPAPGRARGPGRRSVPAGRARRAGNRGTRRRARWRSPREIRSSRSCMRRRATPSCAIVRRQVEHVARRQHLVVLGREAPEDLQRQPRLQREVVLAAEAPAAAPEALQQEDVVRIHVRADARRRARRSSPSGRPGARTAGTRTGAAARRRPDARG